MTPIKREKQFHMMLSDDESEALRELADEAGLSASDYLRMVIRREYRAAFDRAPGKPKRRRKR